MKRRPAPAARLSLALAAAMLLAACQTAAAPGVAAPQGAATPQAAPSDGAAKAIEDYLAARVAADVDKMISLSCAAWEAEARKEAASLRGVKARLEGLACQAGAASAEHAPVACQGDIVATYNGEDRALTLAKRQFKAVLDGDQWRMCGYE